MIWGISLFLNEGIIDVLKNFSVYLVIMNKLSISQSIIGVALYSSSAVEYVLSLLVRSRLFPVQGSSDISDALNGPMASIAGRICKPGV
jgi:hypothetical protein